MNSTIKLALVINFGYIIALTIGWSSQILIGGAPDYLVDLVFGLAMINVTIPIIIYINKSGKKELKEEIP